MKEGSNSGVINAIFIDGLCGHAGDERVPFEGEEEKATEGEIHRGVT